MLENIVDIILSSTVVMGSGFIYWNNIIVANEAVVECIDFLASKSVIENVGYINKVHEKINLELFWNHRGFWVCNRSLPIAVKSK